MTCDKRSTRIENETPKPLVAAIAAAAKKSAAAADSAAHLFHLRLSAQSSALSLTRNSVLMWLPDCGCLAPCEIAADPPTPILAAVRQKAFD